MEKSAVNGRNHAASMASRNKDVRKSNVNSEILIRGLVFRSTAFSGRIRISEIRSVGFGCAAEPARVEPRRIVVKPPFVIMMKRRAAPQPYFATWVSNGEPLRKPDN